MTHFKDNRRKYAICILAGLQVMSFALLLHPMNPEDLLALAAKDPMATITDQYGFGMARMFWFSLILILVGLCGWVANTKYFKKGVRQERNRSSL
jgi:hypothetical protein